MKTTKQHLDALLAVEGDVQFDGIVTSVQTLRRKQNVQSHSQSTTFLWIKTSRELTELERKLSEQLDRMQNDIGLLPRPRCQEQPESDALSFVIGLKDALENSQDKNVIRRREMILDTKQRLNEMEEDLVQQCSALEEEIRIQRRRALQLVSDGKKQCNIPPSLLKAIDSLRALGDEDSEIEAELLKQELLEELNAAKHKRDKTRYEQVKKKGIDRVEDLQRRIFEKSRRTTNKAKSEAKQQQLHAQLKLSRLQQQLKQNQQESSSLECKDIDEKVIGVQRRLEDMQVLAKHHLERLQDHEKENAEVLLQEEMIKQRKMSFNRERSTFREEQREQKIIAKQEQESKMMRERELQLERLSALALSCPYQKTITDLQPDIHKSTNARQNDFFRRQSDLADFQRGRQTSFTDEKLFSDTKFRLANSLHEAGINKTIAARDVIRNVIPRTEERTTGIKPY